MPDAGSSRVVLGGQLDRHSSAFDDVDAVGPGELPPVLRFEPDAVAREGTRDCRASSALCASSIG